MNFPHNGKSLAKFSTQWKRFVHAVERRSVARTHNISLSSGTSAPGRVEQGSLNL